jgi:hypothetical protein
VDGQTCIVGSGAIRLPGDGEDDGGETHVDVC